MIKTRKAHKKKHNKKTKQRHLQPKKKHEKEQKTRNNEKIQEKPPSRDLGGLTSSNKYI